MDACGQSAASAMEQPSAVGGQLLGFRAGQQHAELEGAFEVGVIQPAAAFDQLAVHEGDLADGAAEAEETDFEPDAERAQEIVVAGSGRRAPPAFLGRGLGFFCCRIAHGVRQSSGGLTGTEAKSL